jgi:Tol biopolymer transport system component
MVQPVTRQATSEIAYLVESDIWLLDLASSNTRQVTQRGDVSAVTWTPDGRRLVFAAGAEAADLYAVEPGSSATERLTEDVTREAFPAYSPGGALFFVRHIFDAERSSIDIVRHDPDSTQTIVHSEPGGLCGETGLRLHSETEFTLSLNCGRGRVVLLGNLETGTTINVEESLSAGCAYAAAPAPIGRRLAVLASVECLPDQSSIITLVDLEPQIEPVTRYTGAAISSLDWSPNGAWLVFATSVGDAQQDGLWLLEIESQAEPERLTTSGHSPAWRLDTKK